MISVLWGKISGIPLESSYRRNKTKLRYAYKRMKFWQTSFHHEALTKSLYPNYDYIYKKYTNYDKHTPCINQN